MAEQNKLVRVELQFEDGTVKLLEGEDAKNWAKDINNCVTISTAHGVGLANHNWKETNRYNQRS